MSRNQPKCADPASCDLWVVPTVLVRQEPDEEEDEEDEDENGSHPDDREDNEEEGGYSV